MLKNIEETWFDVSEASAEDTLSQNIMTDDRGSHFSEILKKSLDAQGDVRQYLAEFATEQENISNFTHPLTQIRSKLEGTLRHVDIKRANEIYRTRQASFNPIFEWEGYVIEIREESFIAKIARTKGPESDQQEEAEIFYDELEKGDRNLVQEGAIFRWSIGLLRDSKGTKRRTSQIVFRRLPAWSRRDLTEASERAERLAKLFGKNNGKTARKE